MGCKGSEVQILSLRPFLLLARHRFAKIAEMLGRGKRRFRLCQLTQEVAVPIRKPKLPAYCYHRWTDRAYVTIEGERVYLRRGTDRTPRPS